MLRASDWSIGHSPFPGNELHVCHMLLQSWSYPAKASHWSQIPRASIFVVCFPQRELKRSGMGSVYSIRKDPSFTVTQGWIWVNQRMNMNLNEYMWGWQLRKGMERVSVEWQSLHNSSFYIGEMGSEPSTGEVRKHFWSTGLEAQRNNHLVKLTRKDWLPPQPKIWCCTCSSQLWLQLSLMRVQIHIGV